MGIEWERDLCVLVGEEGGLYFFMGWVGVIKERWCCG